MAESSDKWGAVLDALRMAIRQNSNDMILTGDELRRCELALADAPVSATRPTLRDKYVNAFIATAAGPAFSRDELRKEALAIVEGRGPYAPASAAPAMQQMEKRIDFIVRCARDAGYDVGNLEN